MLCHSAGGVRGESRGCFKKRGADGLQMVAEAQMRCTEALHRFDEQVRSVLRCANAG